MSIYQTEERIRTRNVVILYKLQSAAGVDAAPTASDAIPFELDGTTYNTPYTVEQSNEATGSLVAGAPLVVGQPAQVDIRFRIKGAGAGVTYTSLIKPPHHSVFAACGRRGVFTASVAAAAITAGTVNSATLGTGFGTTAQAYRGMPLQFAAGNSNGRLVNVVDYTSGKVASLSDVFGGALNTSVTAAVPANWTYSGTSPKDAAARTTDHPLATIYFYEDGVLYKFIDCRGSLSDFGGASARPGMATASHRGVYLGKEDAAVPAVTVLDHSAPVLAVGSDGVTPAFLINRRELAISTWSMGDGTQVESPEDPNTRNGFGAGEIGGRTPVLNIDPLATLKATRDIIAEIEAGTAYSGVMRFGSVAGNRWSLTLPRLLPVQSSPGNRNGLRSEQQQLQALNPGVDAAGRDAESILCFY